MILLMRVIVPILFVVLVVATVRDVTRMPPERVRGVGKPVWVALVLLLPMLGILLWYTVGRAEPGTVADPHLPSAQRSPDEHAWPSRASAPRGGAPDDDPEFLARLGLEQQQARRIQHLEAQLRELGVVEAGDSDARELGH